MSAEQPTIDEALTYLRGTNQFQAILADLELDREDAIRAIGEANEPYEVMKGAGRVETINMVISKLAG